MPVTNFAHKDPYTYQVGFNSHQESEALAGALPIGQNSPQKAPYGLYTEKLSGTSFTAPRHENKQTWVYRIIPAASHQAFAAEPVDAYRAGGMPKLRWNPFDVDESVDWVHGLHLIAGAGDATLKQGLGILVYSAGKNMAKEEAFYSADGEFLIVPQHGVLDIQTELGRLFVRPNEVCVIPRGIRYRVELPAGPVRGYICELYQGHFQLPELGPIGSNCLANSRDFQSPVAFYDDASVESNRKFLLRSKFNHRMYSAVQDHTPFDIVAWQGKYYPYKYDLARFNPMGSISFDHPDPSIYTVLTAPSDHPGTAICDFGIFPPRWLVAEDTFRPPWYHRNVMSEFMGLICGTYDAKTDGGFQPAGASLHNIMSGHGPDSDAFEKASNMELEPVKVGEGSMAFMFESAFMLGVTEWGLQTCEKIQENYNDITWRPLKRHFQAP
ncbi:homogentisate 1-2-dioxygenase [Penicillium longicatenatum]|uniref:homogentisate 1-2-dioxygenase n=1 Tax=Penicillium longicatenatum TaxID=1561947 RepID=UPI002547DDA2|nr:homogentisate 1-2-dioxygenase [Penicillium longicatenatum]KAJ5657115.1 homogentisate 1-2-dioxygenase [Penicillium longicatenatum]